MNTHVIRYAKDHYGKSKTPDGQHYDIMGDLKYLIGRWAYGETRRSQVVEFVSDREVLEIVWWIWLEIARDCDKRSLIKDIYYSYNGTPGNASAEEAISRMLSGMRFTSEFPELEPKYDDTRFDAEVYQVIHREGMRELLARALDKEDHKAEVSENGPNSTWVRTSVPKHIVKALQYVSAIDDFDIEMLPDNDEFSDGPKIEPEDRDIYNSRDWLPAKQWAGKVVQTS